MKARYSTPLGILIGALATFTLSAVGDVVVLRETDKNGQPKRLIGRIVDTQGVGDKEAVVIESEGKKRLVLKNKIERIEPSINEKELEKLNPAQPGRYVEIGIEYAQRADELNDPDCRECARHLLRAAMELDEKRYAVEVHTQLARLSDPDEGARHMIEVLRREPDSDWARDQLREIAADRLKRSSMSYDELRPLLGASLRDSRWAPLVSFAKNSESANLFQRLDAAYPGLRSELASVAIPTDCPVCRGSTQIKCDECRNGRVPCQKCNGRGSFQSTQSSGFTDPVSGNYILKKVPTRVRCPTCNGRQTFPCSKCKDGWLTCTACSGRQKLVNVNASLRQRLGEVNAVLNQPARELVPGSAGRKPQPVPQRGRRRTRRFGRDRSRPLLSTRGSLADDAMTNGDRRDKN